MIPPEHSSAFCEFMELHDDADLPLEEWHAKLLEGAEAYLTEFGLREEPKAAVVYYLKQVGRRYG